MNRRLFFQQATAFAALMSPFRVALAIGPSTYKETVSTVLVTADEKKFVVMTERFHYILDAPPAAVQTLKGSFHPYVEATFTDFHVALSGKMTGKLSLLMRAAPEAALHQALTVGFHMGRNGAEMTATLRGERFRASGVTAPNEYKLNKPYTIEVVNEQPESQTSRTPVNPVAAVLVLAGVTLLGVMQLACTATTRDTSHCH